MKSRKVLLALVAATALGGCAAYPYDPNYPNYPNEDGTYYRDGPYYRDYYGSPYYGPYPGYYGPTVGFGITYSDRHYYHRH